VWPLIPAITMGWLAGFLLPDWFGTTLVTLVFRGLITGAVIALTHGTCSGFRCFYEAGGLISQKWIRVRSA
jgi:hypothetical protein